MPLTSADVAPETGLPPAAHDPDAVHPSERRWGRWVSQIGQAQARCQADPGRTLVLVPYAQLMHAGRQAWAQAHPSGFAPRFESTRHWATALQPFVPGPTDLSMDMARDSLVAAALVDRVAPARLDPALRAVLVARLVESTRQLAPLAAAVPPEDRLKWAAPLTDALALGSPSLQWESLLASLALAWASTSAYATDVLWGPLAAPGSGIDALVVLQGYQRDPLASALAARWGARATVLELHEPTPDMDASTIRLHACGDAEDEALRATACVLAQVNAGRVPVALVANDRLLTRRVSAMLGSSGLVVVDETGWKLSTSFVAARLMSLLRAADPRAGMDDVLDCLKQSPAWPEAQVLALEQQARADGVSVWRTATQSKRLAPLVPDGLPGLLEGLQPARPLATWLNDLRSALQHCGQWTVLLQDPAGMQMVQALRLEEGAAHELLAVGEALAQTAQEGRRPARAAGSAGRLSLSGFTAWVREVLEGVSFMPRIPGDAAVVILPLAQLLGRRFPATVVPGCDEAHLNPSPELPGQWTSAQRETLGLPSRETLAQAAAQAWQTALGAPELDVLWRTQERGEAVLPSPWVQALMPAGQTSAAPDPRVPRWLSPAATGRPAPSAPELLPETLSASAYQDLRDCPYRFFAQRQLRLSEAAELEAEPDQRDMGNWLHAVLRAFHEARRDQRPGTDADRQHLDRLALEVAENMGLNSGEGGAGFLPYQAVWPGLREGYLAWLADFEADDGRAGPRFLEAEVLRTTPAGAHKLLGKLDRIDQQDSPEGAIPFVIDYKTESRATTLERVKEPLEDTQLAFYAALLPDENLRAAYLSITDKRGDGPREQGSLMVEQPEVLLAREQLLQGIQHDMARIAAGAPMPALGEGRVCEYCAARGLCRKDFW
jgi:ATP-dependent helicase/nuclease subunit B